VVPIALVLAVAAWRRRSEPAGVPVVLYLLALGGGAATYGVELGTADPSLKFLLTGSSLTFVGIFGGAWLYVALAYAGKRRWLTPRTKALLAVEPALLALSVVVPPLGPHLYRVQATALLVAAVAPWTTILAHSFNIVPSVDASIFTWTLGGVAVTVGLYRVGMLDPVPAANASIVEDMGDGVVVLDENDRVGKVNPAARQLLYGAGDDGDHGNDGNPRDEDDEALWAIGYDELQDRTRVSVGPAAGHAP